MHVAEVYPFPQGEHIYFIDYPIHLNDIGVGKLPEWPAHKNRLTWATLRLANQASRAPPVRSAPSSASSAVSFPWGEIEESTILG